MKKKLLILTVALGALAFTGLFVANNIRAEDAGSYPPIVQKLVERFGLDEAEVQGVFDEAKEERKQEMQTQIENKLDQAVADGELTEEQKQALIDKKAEMHDLKDELRDLDPDERRAVMQEHHDEFKAWLEEQGIDLTGEFSHFGGGYKGGFGHGYWKGSK